MNQIRSLRFASPALLDYNVFSCKTLSNKVNRCLSTAAVTRSADNKNYEINPCFENRNPRALEFMGLAPKRKGWRFQAPRKDYYHRLVYEVTNSNTNATVEHWTGNTVIDASTKEMGLAKYLYSFTDVSASWNVGRLLARRMLEAGITNVFYDEEHVDADSEKKQAFLLALKDSHIELQEADEVEQEHVPGINYDGYNRYDEKKMYHQDYQKL